MDLLPTSAHLTAPRSTGERTVPADRQNRCGVVTPRSVGSTPAPLRTRSASDAPAPALEHVLEVGPGLSRDEHEQPVALADDCASTRWDRVGAAIDDRNQRVPRQAELTDGRPVDGMTRRDWKLDQLEVAHRADFERRLG